MDTNNEINRYLDLILSKLEPLNIFKVILFGSNAHGSSRDDSDIDLLIVLNDTRLPKTYGERMSVRLEVSRTLRDIRKEVPMDLLVFTLPEYEIIKENMNSFYRDIHENGRVIYERAS